MNASLQLGVSTAAFFPHSLAQTLAILTPLPWRAVELMPQTSEECRPAFAAELLALGAGRFDFCAIHFPQILAPFLYNAYPGARRYAEALCRDLAELAGALGSNAIIVHGPWKSMSQGAFYEATLSNFRILCDVGQSYGVTVALENTTSSPFAGSPEDMVAFAARIERSNVSFTVDITHAHQLGQDPCLYLEQLPAIAHVHASDFDLHNQQRHLLPGRGGVEWPRVMSALRQRAFQGNFILELLPDTLGLDPLQGLQESIAFLAPFFDGWPVAQPS